MNNPMTDSKIKMLTLEDIYIDEEFNCRGKIAPIDIKTLADNIKKNGMLQPVVVTLATEEEKQRTGKIYTLLAGFRRCTATKFNKTKTVEAKIVDMPDMQERRILNLQENVVREQLTITQEALALEPLFESGMTEREVMAALDQKRGWVQIRKMLISLPNEIRLEVEAGTIKQTDIRHLYTTGKNTNWDRDALFEHARKIKDNRSKGKGEVRPKSNKPKGEVKRRREKGEVILMQDHLFRLNKGNNFSTRLLGWVNGFVSDEDYNISLQKHCEEEGIVFHPYDPDVE